MVTIIFITIQQSHNKLISVHARYYILLLQGTVFCIITLFSDGRTSIIIYTNVFYREIHLSCVGQFFEATQTYSEQSLLCARKDVSLMMTLHSSIALFSFIRLKKKSMKNLIWFPSQNIRECSRVFKGSEEKMFISCLITHEFIGHFH